MFNVDEETGNITLRQGDSGSLHVDGIFGEEQPEDGKDWVLYMSIYNRQTRQIIKEMSTKPLDNQADFAFTPVLTNALQVPAAVKFYNYGYAIKLCCEADKYEDTLAVADKEVGDENLITVYPKLVEGTNNG